MHGEWFADYAHAVLPLYLPYISICFPYISPSTQCSRPKPETEPKPEP